MTKERRLPGQAILVVNASSREGAGSFKAAVSALDAAGVELIDSIAVTDPANFGGAVADSVKRAPMVIVGAGDGSISSTVDIFAGADTVLAILPFGTANSFARTLGIPLDLDEAVEVIASGRPKRIDLGCIDGHFFANTAVIGLSPLIAETIPSGLKRMLGRAAYLIWAIRWAARFRPFRLTIENESETRRFWATEVRIANGRFFGGIELVDDASVDSGDIVIQAVIGRSKFSLGKNWLGALFRLRQGEAGDVEEFRGTRFRIDTRPHLQVAIDGEPGGHAPIEVSVARSAIDVAVPLNPPD